MKKIIILILCSVILLNGETLKKQEIKISKYDLLIILVEIERLNAKNYLDEDEIIVATVRDGIEPYIIIKIKYNQKTSITIATGLNDAIKQLFENIIIQKIFPDEKIPIYIEFLN